jgi:histone H3/H4
MIKLIRKRVLILINKLSSSSSFINRELSANCGDKKKDINKRRKKIQNSFGDSFLLFTFTTVAKTLLIIMSNNNNDIDDDIDDDENTNNTHHHHQQRQRQKEKLIRNRVLADSIKIAELEAKEHDGVSLSPQAASVLGELVFLEIEKLAFDLKAFAKHRNDRTITKKDVELFVRRSSGDLLECIEDALRKENVS